MLRAIVPAIFVFCAMIARDAAAGSVATVSVLRNGQLGTIQGTGFGVKTNAKPLYFWNFGQSTTSTSPLSRLAYAGTIRGNIADSIVAPGSKTALQVETGGITQPAGPQDGVQFNSTSVYVWIKHRYEFNVVTSSASNGFNLKSFRLWDPWIKDIFVNYQGSSNGTGHVQIDATQDEKPSIWFGWNQAPYAWLIEEYDYQSSSLGQADGILHYIRNGLTAWDYATRFVMRNSAYPNPYSLLFFDQVSNNRIAPGTYQYIDAIYVDDSRQHVIISDEPKWTTAHSGTEAHREIQIPVSWADNQIKIVARLGSFTSLAGKYLYIIDADGNSLSARGFPLAYSESTPSAPTSVSVH
jgi:hypothetical protein